MGMDHASYPGKLQVKEYMRRRIGGGFQLPFHLVAIQVHDDHIPRFHSAIGNTTRLDDHQSLIPVYATCISPGEIYQSVPDKVKVCPAYRFFQFFQHPILIYGNLHNDDQRSKRNPS
jgi:hypothetical protein